MKNPIVDSSAEWLEADPRIRFRRNNVTTLFRPTSVIHSFQTWLQQHTFDITLQRYGPAVIENGDGGFHPLPVSLPAHVAP